MTVTIIKRRDRSNKPWVVTQYVGEDRKRIGFASEDEALEWKAALEIEEGANTAWTSPGAMPCSKIFDAWQMRHGATLARSTEKTNEGLIRNHLKPHFEQRDLRLIDQSDVVEFTNRLMESGKSKALAQNAVSLLRTICSGQVAEGNLKSNPAIGAQRIVNRVARRYATEVPRVDSWTSNEVTRLLAVAKEEEPSLFPAVLCLFNTGIRKGELLALQWRDVDLDRRTITIRRAMSEGQLSVPKNGKARTIPIQPRLHRMLSEMARTRHHREGLTDPEFVFLSPQGRPLMDRNFHRSFTRLTTKAARHGVRALNPHCARHTYATLALQAGQPVHWVSKILGHSSAAITLNTYAHVLPEMGDDKVFIPAESPESGAKVATVSEPPQTVSGIHHKAVSS